jgi:hypothetical protein
MVVVKQLELDLWKILQEASSDPVAAEFLPIWQALDQVLPNLAIVEQLKIAANTIGQVADIFQVQAGFIFEELDATATNDGPTMAADGFDRYVRQYMTIDFEDYIAEPEALPRAPRTAKEVEDGFYSVAESVEKDLLLEVLHDEIGLTEAEAHAEALSVAHGEDISLWIELIRAQLLSIDGVIELEQLRSMLNLHFIELWLGLLLGGYGLSRAACEIEDEAAFYSAIGILVQL